MLYILLFMEYPGIRNRRGRPGHYLRQRAVGWVAQGWCVLAGGGLYTLRIPPPPVYDVM